MDQQWPLITLWVLYAGSIVITDAVGIYGESSGYRRVRRILVRRENTDDLWQIDAHVNSAVVEVTL